MSNSLPDQDDESDSANFMDGYFSWDQDYSDDIQYDPCISNELVEGTNQEIPRLIGTPQPKDSNLANNVDLQSSQNGMYNQFGGAELDCSNDQNKKINKPGLLPRNPKRSVDLSEHEQYFKDQYYKIFVSRKKFEKKLVRQIHNLVLVKEIKNLKKMDREDYRRIDLYFKKYSPWQEQIFRVLKKHKKMIYREILKFDF